MDMKQHRYSVLLVSSSEKSNRSLCELLPESRFDPVTVVADTASAKRAILEKDFDIVIINTPLKDDFGTALALNICSDTNSGVMMMVKTDLYADVNARLMPYGVFAVSKPTSVQVIEQTLMMLCGTRERLRRMEQKTASLEEKMEEMRLVNRAKLLLIDQLKMTEQQAHRYIEKQAMDRCVTKREIAEKIISTYN